MLLVKSIFIDLKIKLFYILCMLENGNFFMQIKASIFLSILSLPFVEVLKIFFFKFTSIALKDESYIYIWFIAIMSDLFTGMWKHLKLHTFDWKRLYIGLLEKVFVSLIGMIIFNSLTSINKFPLFTNISNGLLMIGELANFFYVGGSALSNLYVITGGKFPPIGFMRRMRNFNENLDIDELNPNN